MLQSICRAVFATLIHLFSDAQAVYMMHVSAISNSQIQTGRAAFVVPPFQNLADCPGGYTAASMGIPASAKNIIPVQVVGT